jgi:hypothetical protein
VPSHVRLFYPLLGRIPNVMPSIEQSTVSIAPCVLVCTGSLRQLGQSAEGFQDSKDCNVVHIGCVAKLGSMGDSLDESFALI